jgi:prolipoprotein diacylglyceryl transferase
MEASHFIWTDHRVLFDFGILELPFPLALLGVVAAFLAYGPVVSYLFKPDAKAKKGTQPTEPAWYVQLGIFAALLVVGQVLFNLFPGPKFDEIGPIAVRPYSLLFAGGFIAAYFISRTMFRLEGKPEALLETILVYFAVGTIVGARLGHCLFYDPAYYLTHPLKILAVWEGGLASHGALIGILVAIYLYDRKYPGLGFMWIADRGTVSVALAGAMIRTGNFFNSEIIGTPTDLPWAVVFAAVDPLPRHPSMLYEAFWYLITVFICWRVYKTANGSPPPGKLFGIWLMCIFGGRFFAEFTKVEQAEFAVSLLNLGQWLSIPAVAAGFWLWNRSRKTA